MNTINRMYYFVGYVVRVTCLSGEVVYYGKSNKSSYLVDKDSVFYYRYRDKCKLLYSKLLSAKTYKQRNIEIVEVWFAIRASDWIPFKCVSVDVNNIKPPKSELIIGNHYGHMTIIARGEPYRSPNGRSHGTYVCRCDCGTEYARSTTIIKRGLRSQMCRHCNSVTHNMNSHKKRIYFSQFKDRQE